MSANNQRYKITNTTIKPLRTNARGEDIRPVRERVGYGVQIRLEDPEEYITLFAAGQSKIVSRISEGILKMNAKREISVEVIADIANELKNFKNKPEQDPVVVEPTKTETKLEEMNARSYPMGETRESDLVNPDGEPNFVAKAPKGGMTRVKK